jgi:glutamyl-tRNA synthetase
VTVWAEDARTWWAILDDPPPPPRGGPEEDLRAVLSVAVSIDPESDFRSFVRTLAARTGRRGRALYLPLRLALTGRTEGPELATLWSAFPPERRRAILARALTTLADA